jgi:sec-independent protein translocase protein TatC
MFDIAFSELMLIGVVALVVIGPERLPKVARTAGQWLGRLNRYVSQVKQDIDRDIKLEELRKMQQDMKDSAQKYEIMAGDSKRELETAVEQETGQISRVMQAMSATDGGLSMQEWDKVKAEEAAATPAHSDVPTLPVEAPAAVEHSAAVPHPAPPEREAGPSRPVSDWVVLFVCLFPFANDLYSILAQPLLQKLPHGGQMIATEVVTPFFVPIKVAMMAAFLGALPVILYQIWAFIAPGLYAHERKMIVPLVVASLILFGCGMSFAYFLVFPVVFGFIVGIAPHGVAVMTDIGKYLDFVITMFLAFGITFEVPIVVIALAMTGLVEVHKFKEARPYVIVGAFVIGAIFTPPDVVSQVMLAVPLWLLYEIGVIVAGWMVKNKAAAAAEDAAYSPIAETDLDAELDRIDAEQKKLT